MHNRRFYLKFAAIAFIMVFLLIPQAFILGLVGERAGWREQAYQSIGQSWPGEQTLAGPVLAVPYQLTFSRKESVKDANTGLERETIREETLNDTLYLLPKKLDIHSKLDSSLRSRGIYDVPVYASGLQVSGEFSNQPLLELLADNKDKQFRWEKPYLAVHGT